MSWLSSIVGDVSKGVSSAAEDVGKVGKTVGHAVGQVAENPWTDAAIAAALTATGVGAPAAAAILAGIKGGGALIAPGGNIGAAAKGAATGGIEGGAAGLLGDALGTGAGSGSGVTAFPGIPTDPTSGLAGVAANTADTGSSLAGPGVTPLSSAFGADPVVTGPPVNPVATGLGNASGGINGLTLPATGSSPSSGVTGLLGDLGSFLTGNGGKNALGIAQAINAAAQMSKSQGYATDAYNAANNQYNANAPLRNQAITALPTALGYNPFSGVPKPGSASVTALPTGNITQSVSPGGF